MLQTRKSYSSRFPQAASSNSRRHLAVTDPAEDPYFYPSGGTFHHPIAVSLLSSADSIIYYTTDGVPPDASSDFVLSGDLIVVEDSLTLRAIAVHKDSSFESFSSAEVQATFVVHMAGENSVCREVFYQLADAMTSATVVLLCKKV